MIPYLQTALQQEPHRNDADRDIIERLMHPDAMNFAAPGASAATQTTQDKLQLFITVSRTMIEMAQAHPMLFIMDDLHWADPPSLELFSHLIFTVADAAFRESIPLFIVCAYRPTESDDRLTRLINRWQREDCCQTFELTGLDESEMYELAHGFGIKRPSHQLIATLRETTQGNPLFIQEIIHHLQQQGSLQEHGGYTVTASSSADLRLPAHVTDALVTHIKSLSQACQHVMTVAALLGERFSIDLLSAVCDLAEDDLLDLLEEALDQRLLLNEGQAFQFAHHLIRHALYHQLSVVRRQRLHRRVVAVLEQRYVDDLDTHVMEIAHHIARSDFAANFDQVARYARQAGNQAFALSAWGEAARYYELILAANETNLQLCAWDCAELHYYAGLSRYQDMDVGPCRAHYEKAIDFYRSADDTRGLARVLAENTRIVNTLDPAPLGMLRDMQPLEDVLNRLGSDDQDLQGNILVVMSGAYRAAGQTDKAETIARQALAIGQHTQDAALCSRSSHLLALAQNQNLLVLEAIENWQHALTYAQQADDTRSRLWPVQRMAWTFMQMGRLEEAEARSLQGCDLSHTIHDWGNYSLSLAALASMAVIKGDFALAARRHDEILHMMHRSRYPWGGARSLLTLAGAHVWRGAWSEAEALLNQLIQPGYVFEEAGTVIENWVWVYRHLLNAYTGTLTHEQLAPLSNYFVDLDGADLFNLALFCAVVEIGDVMQTPTMAKQSYQVLSRAVERGILFSSWWLFLVPRILGVAAALNHWWDEAEAHFETAIDVATRLGAKPELGRSYLDHARMLAARDRPADHQRAMALGQQAIAILDELGMASFSAQARQLTAELQPLLATEDEQPAIDQNAFSEAERESFLQTAQSRTLFIG